VTAGVPAPASPGVRSRARRGTALILALALAWSPAAGLRAADGGGYASNLPALGDSASEELSPLAERRLGEEIMRQIRANSDDLDDPDTVEYLNRFGEQLASHAPAGSPGFEFFAVKDPSINAFALPGGFIGVHTGLLLSSQSESELAGVIGHEMGHVTQRHIARSLAAQREASYGTLALLALAILAGRAGNGQVAQAAAAGGVGFAAQNQLAFSREAEREADRVGVQFLEDSGFDVTGMVDFFGRLQKFGRLYENNAPAYLRTHPLTTERIGDARTRLALTSFSRPHGLAVHALMAARSRVLMDPRVDAWKVLENYDAGARDLKGGGSGFEQLGARYAAALASIKLRNFDRAEASLRSAELTLQLVSSNAAETAVAQRVLTLLRAELAQARERPADGFAALDTLKGDKSRPVLMQRVALALVGPAGPALRDAADTLQTHVSLDPSDAYAWSQLALVWDKLGQPLRAVRAQAETRAAAGDINGAIDRLRSGLRQSRRPDADQVEASVIESRLRTLVYQRQSMLAEMYPGRNIPPDVELPN